jgi:hypothetical protein
MSRGPRSTPAAQPASGVNFCSAMDPNINRDSEMLSRPTTSRRKTSRGSGFLAANAEQMFVPANQQSIRDRNRRSNDPLAHVVFI